MTTSVRLAVRRFKAIDAGKGGRPAPVLLTRAALRAHLPAHDAHVVRLDADWPAIAQQPEISQEAQEEQERPVAGKNPSTCDSIPKARRTTSVPGRTPQNKRLENSRSLINLPMPTPRERLHRSLAGSGVAVG
jgi:hypothetical protein